jgi:hypothetical protein
MKVTLITSPILIHITMTIIMITGSKAITFSILVTVNRG